jgi:hypothetical protein
MVVIRNADTLIWETMSSQTTGPFLSLDSRGEARSLLTNVRAIDGHKMTSYSRRPLDSNDIKREKHMLENEEPMCRHG